jgi:hypothetical protein
MVLHPPVQLAGISGKFPTRGDGAGNLPITIFQEARLATRSYDRVPAVQSRTGTIANLLRTHAFRGEAAAVKHANQAG